MKMIEIISSPRPSWQSRTELALLTSLFSLFLSLLVLLPPDHCIKEHWCHHSVIKCSNYFPLHPKGPQSPQQMKVTLVVLVQGVHVVQSSSLSLFLFPSHTSNNGCVIWELLKMAVHSIMCEVWCVEGEKEGRKNRTLRDSRTEQTGQLLAS